MIKILGMGRKKLDKEPTNITLPKQLKAEAAAYVEKQSRTLSSLVEELLRDHLASKSTRRKPAK
jgi:hypothetical protein